MFFMKQTCNSGVFICIYLFYKTAICLLFAFEDVRFGTRIPLTDNILMFNKS